MKNLRSQIETSNERINSYDYEVDRTMEHITEKKVERLVSVNVVAAMQKMTRAYEDIKTSGQRKATENQKKQLGQLVEENSRMAEAIVRFAQDNPKFSGILRTVGHLSQSLQE